LQVLREAGVVRFAVPCNHRRLGRLVRELDREDVPYAETWRRVGAAAETFGERRPSYGHVRRLVQIERARRELRARRAAVLLAAASTTAAGRVPSFTAVLVQLRELALAEELVLQEHKAFFDPG
jgi:hypothetical protein